MTGTMHTTRHDLPAEQREALVALLNGQLADTFDLYSQTKFAHWNVKGSDFIQLHLLFDQFAEHLIGFVDLIAERATTLGGPPSAPHGWRPPTPRWSSTRPAR